MSAWGVDGCRAGWCFFGLDGADWTFGTVARLADAVARADGADRVFVDIPIGLPGAAPRRCDTEARRLLGRRGASVFPAPPRAALGVAGYAAANAASRRVTGRGLSRQSFNIRAKVAEADALVRNDAHVRRVVREVHPEVCFHVLGGGRPPAAGKKTQAGFAERIAILGRHWPGAEDAAARALLWHGPTGVARDDVVDALVNAVTAAAPVGRLRTLPADPPRDACGLAMEMVYALPGC